MSDNHEQYLASSEVIDHQHPAVKDFIAQHDTAGSQLDGAIAVYYAVRDLIRYDPFTARMDKASFKASETLSAGRGWCVPKAVLLTACYRAMGIPAKLGFADVSNHLSTEKMREAMKTDIFYWHGYTSVLLNNKWVKATPAFNIELCEKFDLKPLEFNGLDDSLYHEFDNAGNKHMEYLNDRGNYADLPYEELCADFDKYYPGIFDLAGINFDDDVAREVNRNQQG